MGWTMFKHLITRRGKFFSLLQNV